MSQFWDIPYEEAELARWIAILSDSGSKHSKLRKLAKESRKMWLTCAQYYLSEDGFAILKKETK